MPKNTLLQRLTDFFTSSPSEKDFNSFVNSITTEEIAAALDSGDSSLIATHIARFLYAVAVLKKYPAMFKTILALIPENKLAQIVNIPDQKGNTALHWALILKQEDCAMVVLKTGKVDFKSINEASIASLLRTAAYYGFSDTINEILAQIPIDKLAQSVNVADIQGHSALHYAAANAQKGCIAALLKIDMLNPYTRGAIDTNHIIAKATALDLAVEAGCKGCVLTFISHANKNGATIPQEALATAIYCAKITQDQEIESILNDYARENYPQGIQTFTGGDPALLNNAINFKKKL